MKLEAMRWPQVEEYFARKDTVVISTGSIENHGTHLALGTDFIVPQKLIDMVDERLDIIFTPVLPFGSADHHMGFSGTISLGDQGLYVVISAIAESLYKHGARRFIFLNGHGGNIGAISRVGMELNKKGALSALLNWWQIAPQLNKNWGEGHASGQETAACLAIDPQYVSMPDVKEVKATELTENLPAKNLGSVMYKGVNIPVMRTVDKLTKAGWFGIDHPQNATAEWGKEMLEAIAEFTISFINEFEKAKIE